MDRAILEFAFVQANLKIDRAYRHIDEAQQWFGQYLATDFCEIVEELHAETGDRRYVAIAQPLTVDVALSIGDAFHCLNVALDYVTTGMMRSKGLSAGRVSFPTHDTREALRKTFMSPKPGKTPPPNRRILEAFPAFGCLLFTAIQPYRGGNLKVWEVRKADNIDKHNIIIPHVAVTKLENVHLVDEVNNNQFTAGTVHVAPGGRCSLIRMSGGRMIIKDKGNASASITFPQGLEVFAGNPVFSTITQCAELVREACALIKTVANRAA